MTWTRQQTFAGEFAIVWVYANSLLRFSVFLHDGAWQVHWGRQHRMLTASDETNARLEAMRFVVDRLTEARRAVTAEGQAMAEAAKVVDAAKDAGLFEKLFRPDPSRNCCERGCGRHPIVPMTKKCGPCTFRRDDWGNGEWFDALRPDSGGGA